MGIIPTFVARRQTEKRFTSTTLLDASHLNEGMQAGISGWSTSPVSSHSGTCPPFLVKLQQSLYCLYFQSHN